MDRELNFDLQLTENITWQYDQATALGSLINSKQDWFAANWGTFFTSWEASVFNLKTANVFGCVVWSIILDIPISLVYSPPIVSKPFGFGSPPSLVVPVANEQFGTGNNSTTSFQLSYNGSPVAPYGTPVVFKNDWQGNQRLYTTPRTNLLRHSNTFSNAVWTLSGVTLVANAAVAPDGTTTATKVVTTNTLAEHTYFQSANTPALAEVWMHTYVKAAELSAVCLRGLLFTNQSTRTELRVNLLTGAYTVAGLGFPDAKVEQLANGWWKLSIKSIRTSADNLPSRLSVCTLTDIASPFNNQGDGVSGVYVWESQMELGTAPTSTINTTATAVTVPADYTITAGGVVTTSTPPAGGALMSWTGEIIVVDITRSRSNFYYSNFYGAGATSALSLDEARRLLRVRYYAQTMSTNISNINWMLKDVFGDLGLAYVQETLLPMQQRYIFTFPLTVTFKNALDKYLPRGAAVKSFIVTP